MEPDTIFHASAGAIGIASGAVALFTRKGAPWHRGAGHVFFIAMMTTAVSAVYLGFRTKEYGNLIAGVLTCYMLATAWATVRRAEGRTGLFELVAFLLAASGSLLTFWFTAMEVRSGTAFMGGIPGFSFASVVGLAALLDLHALVRRGLSGKSRIARHLWRMHMGYFTAVGSFFPGQLQFFPEYIQNIRPIILLFVPPFLIVGLMFFWLARLFLTRWYTPQAESA